VCLVELSFIIPEVKIESRISSKNYSLVYSYISTGIKSLITIGIILFMTSVITSTASLVKSYVLQMSKS